LNKKLLLTLPQVQGQPQLVHLAIAFFELQAIQECLHQGEEMWVKQLTF
jgi:hypothetical protein